ncbi:MAG: hypothetical protein FWG87_02970 [Defluviitaleaceae bacterium]|nr:hypothetical protein [Defluviitaleaceae bacterium]
MGKYFTDFPRTNPQNLRKSVKSALNKSFVKSRIKGICRFFVGDGLQVFCRGRIYPSRGTHVRQFGESNVH